MCLFGAAASSSSLSKLGNVKPCSQCKSFDLILEQLNCSTLCGRNYKLLVGPRGMGARLQSESFVHRVSSLGFTEASSLFI